MKAMKLALALAAAACPALASAAGEASNPLHAALGSPADWKISGSFRARIEGIDNQFRPAPVARSDALLSFRTTLFAEYDPGPIRLGAELIDARGYLQRDRSSVGTGEVNALELSQAYVALDLAARFGEGTASSLTLGRFTMDQGSRRLVARNAFRNSINAFTGARLDWRNGGKDRLSLFWVMPHYRLPDEVERIHDNEVERDRESPDLQLYGGTFTKAGVFGGSLELYGYALHERDSATVATRNRHLFTPGARLWRAPKAGTTDWDVEAVYQTGRARASASASDMTDLDVSAWFVHAEIGHSFAGAWPTRVALQYDRGSGDGAGARSYGRFDSLFGTRRWEYGPTGLWGTVQRSNLSSPALRLEIVPDRGWDGLLAWRGLWLDKATDAFSTTGVRDPAGASGRFAGQQVETRLRYWLVPKVARIEGGAALLFKGRFLKTAPNAPGGGTPRYGYMDLTLTF